QQDSKGNYSSRSRESWWFWNPESAARKLSRRLARSLRCLSRAGDSAPPFLEHDSTILPAHASDRCPPRWRDTRKDPERICLQFLRGGRTLCLAAPDSYKIPPNQFSTLSILRPCLTHKRDRMTFRQDLEEILRMDNSGALTSHLSREYSRLQFKFAYNQTIKGGYYAALGCL